jgi:hypothetical protein
VRPVLLLLVLAVALARPAPATRATTIAAVGANQSFNWAGYMLGALERNTTFHQIAADWIVPKAKQHIAGQAESSASWIGIGGGCVDAGCTVGDTTLIQAGIEHEIDEAGSVTYYAWWETIPGPQVKTDLPVRAGDHVRVEISEDAAIPELWTISIANVSARATFTLTLPYSSTYATAEWVIETPVVITESEIRVGPMPDLAPVRFDRAIVNGAPAAFTAQEQLQLVDGDLNVISSPSLPDRERDGFNDCTYRNMCPVPGNPIR